ncbi:MAG: TonB-dependent receptor [Robiginitomaculum sp.]|nr:MAG: TonB-dependent receptor [Robiginitomaculum sp.]
MTSINHYLLSGVAALAICSAPTTQAFAQALDEIVVTATRREKNVQDIPISVAVLGAQEIAKADIHGADGIANNVPGFQFSEFAPGQALFSMRGVGSFDDGAGLDNSVALFLDGVYVGRGAGVNFDMFDLERIEVLKGPQGALFGRNTIGGAISVVTQKPSDEFTAKLSLTGGNEGTFRAQGLVSGPIAENLSGKIVVSHRRHDGFVRNTHLNKDVANEDNTSVRGQLRFQTENSDWIVSADYMKDDTEDAGRFVVKNGNFDYKGAAATLGADKPWTTASPIEGYNDRESKGLSLTGDINFDKGVLTTITAFRDVETDWGMPSVGAPLGGGFNVAAGVFGADVQDAIAETVDTFSQEIRWTSDTDGNFEYVVGAFYFTEDTDRTEEFKIDFNSVASGQITVGNEYVRTQNESTSYAVYGQGNWDFADQWSLLAGGRYSHDKKDYIATAVNCGLASIDDANSPFKDFAPCAGVARDGSGSLGVIAEAFEAGAKESWSDFSPMASLQYRPNGDVMLFGTIATGYKSGGFAGSQGVETAATLPVSPEGVINYEIGVKSYLADRTIRLNATAFYMDYKDLQVVRFGPVAGSTFGSFQTTNVGKASIKGFEVEADWAVSENLTLNGSYAYLDSEAKELKLQTFTGTADFSGLPLRQAPKHSYNFVVDYDLPLMGNKGDVNLHANLSHTGESHNDFATASQTINEARTLLDGSVSWTAPNTNYKLALWAKNLTNEAYVSHSYFIGPGTIGTWGAPRTYGVTATVSY